MMKRRPNSESIRLQRPKRVKDRPSPVDDSKVGQLDALLRASGVLPQIEAQIGKRPGPAGVPPRTILLGLLLAVNETGKATVADAWRVLYFHLTPTAQGWLGIAPIDPRDTKAGIAASRRLYRALDRITTAFDPARHDRRTRLTVFEATPLVLRWEDPASQVQRDRLQWICNLLVLAPVRIAKRRGHLRAWRGDLGVDATPVATLARPGRRRKGTASTEITAGWHKSGGTGPATYGYSGHLLVAGHSAKALRKSYPQMCLGMALETPSKRAGEMAVTLLTQLQLLGFPVGKLAVDRAYPYCKEENFQSPARRLGYTLAMDYKRKDRGNMKAHEGNTPLMDGCLACPLTPKPLLEATKGLNDKAVRKPSAELQKSIEQREPFYLHIKQRADHRGAIRVQCPAAGPSPSVNCPRHDRLHPSKKAPTAGPRKTIKLEVLRNRTSDSAAKPTVQVPAREQENPPDSATLPAICRGRSMTVHAHQSAKFRQDEHYLSEEWAAVYKPIRAHNEGANGRLKNHEIDIGNRKHRPARGRVAQSLLLAIMICIGNLQILNDWRLERGSDFLDDAHYAELAPMDTQAPPPTDLGPTPDAPLP
jgi:hypothetical protein